MPGMTVRGKLGEVQVVVKDLTGVVEQGARFRVKSGMTNDLFKGQFFQAGAGEQFVQVVHVRLEVFAVMEFEGPCGNHGFEGVKRVWEVDEFKHVDRY